MYKETKERGKIKMKKTLERQNGITLIALVITIIVLLILAGVVIATLSGENGILRRAGEASDNTKRAQFIEELKLGIMDKQMEKRIENGRNLTGADVKDVLTSSGYFTSNAVSGISDNATVEEMKALSTPLTSTNGYEIKLGEVLSSVTTTGSGGGGGATGTQPTKANIGEYVQYGNSTNSGLDLNGDSNYTNDWRIFYTNNDGVFIIAANVVPVSNSLLATAINSSNANMGTSENNSNVAFWPANSEYTGSDYLTINTINQNTTSKFMNSWTNTSYGNGKATAALLKTDAWSGFTNGINGAYAIGAPTIEMWVASWNEKGYINLYTEITNNNNYGYYLGTMENPSNYEDEWGGTGSFYVDVSEDDGINDDLYFPQGNYSWYWLASPSAKGDLEMSGVYKFGMINYMQRIFGDGSLRPLIYIPSTVIWDKASNNIWQIQ